jgi:signal transduction histidine kinase
MTRRFGLRAALIMLVLISMAPVSMVMVQASLEEQRGRQARAQASLLGVVDLAAAHQQRLVDGARQMLIAMANAPPLYQDDLAACAAYLHKLQAQVPVSYGTFGLLDEHGRLTCRATPPPALVVSSDRLFFRTAVETGRFSVGELVVSRASGRPVLVFGLPVYRGGGDLRGVAYVALDVGQADEQLRAISLSPEITLMVADPGGLALASAGAQPVRVGAGLPEEFLRAAVATGRPVSGQARGTDGREWLYSVEPVGRDGEHKLFVAAMASLDQILAPSTLRLRAQLAALALIGLLAAAAAWLFAERILLQPVRQLLQRVDTLAREELQLDGPAGEARVHELRELHLGFHDMACSLAERAKQRDAAMADMAHQKTLLESVLASMAEGVLVVDPRGRFLHVNDAAGRILGGIASVDRGAHSLEVSRDWGVFDLDSGEPCGPQQWPMRRALEGRPAENFRYRVRGPLSLGEEKVIQGNARPVRTPDGAPAGAVIVYSDATQAWRAEQALRHLNETLERRVDERTRELFIANKELESFSYSVSHDLRAPLQVIDGFGRALQTRHAGQLDPQAMHYLDRIRDNTQQMGNLIDDLLALASVTRAEIRSERVDLGAKAAELAENLRQRFPAREVDLHIETALVCEGDSRLLGIALQNLLENAWKFTANAQGAWVRVGRRQGADGACVFYVADNGAGFDMAYADKLFTPFQRLHSAEEFEGTGIGLATVHRIVSRHGGRVWAEGSLGRGATFLFSLSPRSSR